jgi:uncharacterized protein involved in exopolysaccharide biosynthesis
MAKDEEMKGQTTSLHVQAKYNEEVELIDYLRVLWKYKFWIIGMTLLSALIVLAISFLLPPIWEVSMVIEPGRFGSDVFGHGGYLPTGRIYYVDTAENVKAKILQGSYDTQVRTISEWPSDKKIKWEVEAQTGSTVIKASLEVKDKEIGIKALNALINSLEKEFTGKLEPFLQGELEQNIIKNREDITKSRKDIESIQTERDANLAKLKDELNKLKREIALLKQRELELSQEEGNVRKNTELLMAKRDDLIEGGQSRSDPLSLVLYTTSLQQNIAYSNQLMTQLNEVRRTIEEKESSVKKAEIEMLRIKEDALIRIKKLESDIQKIFASIKGFEEQKRFAKPIEIIQPPTISYRPVKPKKLLNGVIAGIVGFMISVFGAFFKEYISGKKEKVISKS